MMPNSDPHDQFLPRLDKLKDELLYYPPRRHRRWQRRRVSKILKFYVKVLYVMGKVLSGELSRPCDRSCSVSTHMAVKDTYNTVCANSEDPHAHQNNLIRIISFYIQHRIK